MKQKNDPIITNDINGFVRADIKDCPRCHKAHANIVVNMLTNPVKRKDNFTHWSMCPILKEPIMWDSRLIIDPNIFKRIKKLLFKKKEVIL
jgi:hypothetical protein